MHYKRTLLILLSFVFIKGTRAQADNEIQVYASPTIQRNWTIFELHTNHTFKGSLFLANPKSARWTNTTLEITHGVANNFELGFYTFASFSPEGRYQYLGNQIRPRITVPQQWKWPLGASLSVEFGFFRPDEQSSFFWQGEVRPILDKTLGNWYFSLNPNIDFALSGPDKGAGFSPQFKAVYTIKNAVGIGFEYYGALGSFSQILPGQMQEHLIGPMFDL
ncbi:MAG TPA: hypothetical protein VEX63_05455, partial [Flavisolibacter sp.]|nr:hypothetical protein [Flavisolibacter sp.]